MESYQALYRKHRPDKFDQVVGQHHITAVLKNQIQTGRSAHAYLLCGSRGTGKTSTAKIFARTVNCLSPVDGEACGICEACKYMAAEDMDIIEIDAASNNGVDDMRTIIEQARFMPLKLRYKVYIIDEVHMLSNNASNALLKTLEEPPEHVKFLLATTEPQKLLATVVSRCQRFDFKRLNLADIVDTLRKVVKTAGADMEEEGLYIVARGADGGMRDALSILDQCLSFCGGKVTAEDVYDVLGSMDKAYYFGITDALIQSDAPRVLRMLEELVENGRNLAVFIGDLAEHLRALLLVKVCGDCNELLACTEDTMRQYAGQAEGCSQERLLRALELVSKTQADMKWLAQPRILVEAMLVRICRPEDESTVLALEDRINRLEALLEKGVPVKEGSGNRMHEAEANRAISREDIQGDVPWEMKKQGPMPLQVAPNVEKSTAVAVEDKRTSAYQHVEKCGESVENEEGKAKWEALRKALQKQNAALYVLSMGAKSAAIGENRLVVTFPKAKEEAVKALSSPQKMELLQAILEGVAPDLKLHIRIQDMAESRRSNEEQEKDLLSMFGDKLSIEE